MPNYMRMGRYATRDITSMRGWVKGFGNILTGRPFFDASDLKKLPGVAAGVGTMDVFGRLGGPGQAFSPLPATGAKATVDQLTGRLLGGGSVTHPAAIATGNNRTVQAPPPRQQAAAQAGSQASQSDPVTALFLGELQKVKSQRLVQIEGEIKALEKGGVDQSERGEWDRLIAKKQVAQSEMTGLTQAEVAAIITDLNSQKQSIGQQIGTVTSITDAQRTDFQSQLKAIDVVLEKFNTINNGFGASTGEMTFDQMESLLKTSSAAPTGSTSGVVQTQPQKPDLVSQEDWLELTRLKEVTIIDGYSLREAKERGVDTTVYEARFNASKATYEQFSEYVQDNHRQLTALVASSMRKANDAGIADASNRTQTIDGVLQKMSDEARSIGVKQDQWDFARGSVLNTYGESYKTHLTRAFSASAPVNTSAAGVPSPAATAPAPGNTNTISDPGASYNAQDPYAAASARQQSSIDNLNAVQDYGLS